VESLGKVGRLREWHTTEAADQSTSDDALLATKNADLESRVLRSLEHLVPVKAIECLCSVLARDGAVDEDRAPAGMQVSEAG
jgi:hypothetical protein